MEDSPRHGQSPLSPEGQQSDQDEDQLAGVQVTEQTQGERDRFGQQADAFEQQVDRNQEDLQENIAGGEGVQGQLTNEAANALDLDAVEDDQRKHRQGHAQGGVDVGSGYDLHVFDAGHVEQLRQEVDGYQVHEVHQEDPAEDGQ